MIVLETERLLLRYLSADDAPFIVALLNDPGWLRFIGDKSVRTLDDARAYLSNGPIAMYAREGFEKELELLCENNNIGVIPYYGLASGFLTGKYRSETDLDKSPRGGGVKKYLNDRGFRILNGLDEVASQHNANPAQVALAWLMHRPSITAPIASATNLDQLHDLVNAAGLKLTEKDIELLNLTSEY